MGLKSAWIGLGVMGFPMVGHLQRKTGSALAVYNRTTRKAELWQEKYSGTDWLVEGTK